MPGILLQIKNSGVNTKPQSHLQGANGSTIVNGVLEFIKGFGKMPGPSISSSM